MSFQGQMQTSRDCLSLSAQGHKQTHMDERTAVLFDHLISVELTIAAQP